MTTAIVAPGEAAAWLASGEAILIDVREPDEFRSGHIACAASLPLASVGNLFSAMQVPAGRKVIFQCQKGSRGEAACGVVKQVVPGHDFYNLEGGLSGWKDAGLPVVGERPGTAAPSLFRQVQIVVGTIVAASVLAGFAGWQAGFVIAGLVGTMLAIAGITGWCGMVMLLSKMPWNKAT
jgi:rhodanese-related sulfurtransferase